MHGLQYQKHKSLCEPHLPQSFRSLIMDNYLLFALLKVFGLLVILGALIIIAIKMCGGCGECCERRMTPAEELRRRPDVVQVDELFIFPTFSFNLCCERKNGPFQGQPHVISVMLCFQDLLRYYGADLLRSITHVFLI